MIEEYPDDKYAPSCLLLGFFLKERPLHLQVSYADTPLVKIITLYEPDEHEWYDSTEVAMFHCHICGSHEAHQEVVSEVFEIDGHPVLVENIPAEVCIRCSEAVFSRETTERVRRMVHGEAKPVKPVQMDVFAFS